MTAVHRDSVRELLRRVDEVRGLSQSDASPSIDPEDPGALLAVLQELVQELERSHRRLIETNVQLVSLREMASSMVGTLDAAETTKRVTRYLCRAFGFQDGFLLLADRETGRLCGTWTHAAAERDQSWTVDLPLLGDAGTAARALWLNRTLVHHAARRHRPLHLPDGHPLEDALEQLGSTACVPLQRSHTVLPLGETHELCGARCILGDAALIAPPPGKDADAWVAEREERQRQCLGCELMPLLGVIGMARRRDSQPIAAHDVMLLESIALSVAPMIENARLYQDLRRSERFRNHVLDSMAGALVAVGMEGAILTFNRAAEELLGLNEADVLGQPLGAVLGSDAETLVRETLEHGREATRVETMLRRGDGDAVPVSLTTSLLRNDRRAIYGAIATFVDLTPLKRAEEQARQLDRLATLGRFTSSIAHEIRNPLTGIGAGVQYFARSIPEGDSQRENLSFILSEITRLDRIVQELFDVTHPRRLDRRPALIADTVRRAVQSTEALFVQGGVVWEMEAESHTPPVAHDADQMQQVFINLLKNAVEASAPHTKVRVRITAAGRTHGLAPAVAVHVEDQGCGIPPDQQRTVFEPFVTTKPGGTGLGLYITHDIVKRHGGNLTVQSEPGRGTRFTVELPVEHPGGLP